jgi:cytochrome c-type biogenesis protein CcmF
MVIGITGATAWNSETVGALAPGEALAIAGYDVTFRGAAPRRGPNYQETIGRFDVTRGSSMVTVLEPTKRTFTAPRQATTQAAIYNALAGDLYVVLGDALDGGGFVVRAYFHPLVRLIWIGALIMGLGGLLSMSDRRLRIGAGRRLRAGAPSPQAAE